MTPAKKESRPKMRYSREMRDVVYHVVNEVGKGSMLDIMDVAKDELKKKFGIEVSAQRLLGNYYNWLQTKKKQTKIASDPNDIRYILIVYMPSGGIKPTLCCDKAHLTAAVQKVTDESGGEPPKMKIFSPVVFKVNIVEEHVDNV